MKQLLLTVKNKDNYMRNGRCDFVSWCGCQWYPVQMARLGVALEKHHEVTMIDAQAWDVDDNDLGRMIQGGKYERCWLFCGNIVTDIDIAMAKHLNSIGIETRYITHKELKHTELNIYNKFISQFLHEQIPDQYKNSYVAPSEPYPFIDMLTSIGCSYGKCMFCSSNGIRFQELPIHYVVDEMEWIENETDYKSIMIQDDNLYERRALDISIERIKRKLKTSWSCYARPVLSQSVMFIMKRSGVKNLHCGFESGNDSTLLKYHKGIKTDRMRIFMKDAKEAGVSIHGDFIINPDESDEEIKRTIDFACELNPETAQFQAYLDQSAPTEVSDRVKSWQRKAYLKFYGSLKGAQAIINQIGKPKILKESIKSCLK